MLVGYVRVSSLDQNPERQLEELKAMQVEKIFMDKLSGKNVKRPELQNMLNFVREGDTLVVHSLDRLARNLSDLLTMVQDLTGRGVSVRFLNERLDFDAGKEASPVAKLMLCMVGAFAETQIAPIPLLSRLKTAISQQAFFRAFTLLGLTLRHHKHPPPPEKKTTTPRFQARHDFMQKTGMSSRDCLPP